MDTSQWLIDTLIPTMQGVRHRRLFIENEWLDNYRAWRGWPNLKYMLPLPDNSIHYFIPHLRKAIERSVKRASQLLLPYFDRLQTLPTDNLSHANAEAVHNVMDYIIRKKIPFKRNISSGLRCLQLYNFTSTCTSAIIQRDEVWPFQRVVDPFNFYIYPDTANSIEEATLIFEDCILPYQVYASFVDEDNTELGLYKKIDPTKLQKPTWPYHVIERLAFRGLTNPDDVSNYIGHTLTLRTEDVEKRRSQVLAELQEQNKHFVCLSKVYFRVSSYWFYTVLCTNIIGGSLSKYNTEMVRLDETETQPLYRWTTTRPLPGELYTNAPADDNRVLQNLANNSLSQVEAHRATFAEPPLLFNAQTIARTDSKVFGNRRIWLVDGDPREVFAPFPVQDTASEGIRAWQIYKQLIDSNSGGEMAEGNPGRNMPRNGDMAGMLLDMSLIDVKDDAQTYEEEVLTPGLSDIYHIVLEFLPERQIIKIPNKNANLVKAYKKDDLYGDYSFNWLGSLAFQGVQERADKFATFFATLTNPQALPILLKELHQQGLKIDFVSILRTWYSYALGEKGLGDIIAEMTPEEQQQVQQELQQAQQAQAQQTQSTVQRAQAQLEGTKIKSASAQQKAQADLLKARMDMQSKSMEMQAKQQEKAMDLQGKQMDIQGKHVDLRGKLLDFNIKRLEAKREASK